MKSRPETSRLDAIEARANAATPGDWCTNLGSNEDPAWVETKEPHRVAQVFTGTKGIVAESFAPPVGTVQQFENAIFIAHAREDVPWLVAELRAALEAIDAEHARTYMENAETERLRVLVRNMTFNLRGFGHADGEVTESDAKNAVQDVCREMGIVRAKLATAIEALDRIESSGMLMASTRELSTAATISIEILCGIARDALATLDRLRWEGVK